MYLGFLIHVFLHFLIIQTKIGKRPLADNDLDYSSYVTSSPESSPASSEYADAEDDLDLV